MSTRKTRFLSLAVVLTLLVAVSACSSEDTQPVAATKDAVIPLITNTTGPDAPAPSLTPYAPTAPTATPGSGVAATETPTPHNQVPTVTPAPARTVTQPGANVWKFDREPVPTEIIISFAGPGHCGWESATLLHIGSPLGSVMKSGRDVSQYLRDPEGVFSQLTDRLQSTYDQNADLPSDAEFSGYVRNGVELWMSQSQIDKAIFMVDGSRVERWPKAEPIILCA